VIAEDLEADNRSAAVVALHMPKHRLWITAALVEHASVRRRCAAPAACPAVDRVIDVGNVVELAVHEHLRMRS